jgi:hypothetical protein
LVADTVIGKFDLVAATPPLFNACENTIEPLTIPVPLLTSALLKSKLVILEPPAVVIVKSPATIAADN